MNLSTTTPTLRYVPQVVGRTLGAKVGHGNRVGTTRSTTTVGKSACLNVTRRQKAHGHPSKTRKPNENKEILRNRGRLKNFYSDYDKCKIVDRLHNYEMLVSVRKFSRESSSARYILTNVESPKNEIVCPYLL